MHFAIDFAELHDIPCAPCSLECIDVHLWPQEGDTGRGTACEPLLCTHLLSYQPLLGLSPSKPRLAIPTDQFTFLMFTAPGWQASMIWQ